MRESIWISVCAFLLQGVLLTLSRRSEPKIRTALRSLSLSMCGAAVFATLFLLFDAYESSPGTKGIIRSFYGAFAALIPVLLGTVAVVYRTLRPPKAVSQSPRDGTQPR